MRILRAPSIGLGRRLVLCLGLGLLNHGSFANADDREAPLPAAFTKKVPEIVKDLKEIQEHVEKLLKKTVPATVGIIVGQAQGSGIIVTKEGLILTAGQISGTADRKCKIIMPDGKMLSGKTLGADHGIDSGMIQFTEKGEYPFCEMADSAQLESGQWCMAIGHPGGYQKGRQPVVRLGRVQSTSKTLIQTDCTLVGGDFGGPLFDMHGKVIGIHSRIGNAITANIHVPVNAYRDSWDRLAKGEEWGSGLGFGQTKRDDAYIGLTLDSETKDCRILNVAENSPAEKAGLKANDIVRLFDGKKIATTDDLIREMQSKRPGNEVALEVLRGADTVRLRVTLSKRPG
jgi:serine protease Do